MEYVLFQGVSQVTAASLAISYPTISSAPHMLINGLKNLVAVAVETEIEFKEATTFKEYLKVINLIIIPYNLFFF